MRLMTKVKDETPVRRSCRIYNHRASFADALRLLVFAFVSASVLPSPSEALQCVSQSTPAAAPFSFSARIRCFGVGSGETIRYASSVSSTEQARGKKRTKAKEGSRTTPSKAARRTVASNVSIVRGRTSRDEHWKAKLDELCAFHAEHGHSDVTRSFSPTLASWAVRQRREYAALRRGQKSSMTPYRIKKLEEIGFRWTLRGSNGKFYSREVRWEKRLGELKRWKEEYGHVDVPEIPDGGRWKELANWVKQQRAEYSRYQSVDGQGSSLTPERIQKLEALGFTWDIYERSWENRVSQLEEYLAENGNCNVPLSYGSLGDWVLKLRTNYNRLKSGREPTVQSLLTPERIQRLEELGFDFDPQETQFRSYLSKLERFRLENGHINVGTKKGKLSGWYYRQRSLYKKLLAGSNSTGITPPRRRALENVGFHPDMFNRTTASRDDELDAPRARWEVRLTELRDYASEHGHCNVPWSQGSLGRWVKEQRFTCRNETRLRLLNEVGFIWDVRDYVWWSRWGELKEYGEKHGHVNVPHSAGELGEWVAQLRRRYKDSTWLRASNSDEDEGEGGEDRLIDARFAALEKLGFVWDRGEEIQSKRDKIWDKKFESLREFKEEYGHCRVPVGHDPSLCYWVQVQRKRFNDSETLDDGKRMGMSERRIKMLESIGFE